MKTSVILALAVALLVIQSSLAAHAQNKGWRVYSPPDGSFSVELPAPLRKVASFEGEHGASLASDQRIRWASCYAAIETTPEDSRFGIIVINGRAKFLRWQPREEFLSYLRILIGDDDRPEPTSETVIHANGLKGKEYVYTSGMSTRGRIFDTGSRIYILVFVGRVGRDDEDLTSPAAERFFNSFRAYGQGKR